MAKEELQTVKVEDEGNAADGLTKYVDGQRMEQHVKACSMARRSGGHELSPQLGDSAWAFFLLETVLVCIAVFCPSGRWNT